MPVKIPELPYDQDALAPHISEKTMAYHYGKHHLGYFNKLSAATDGTDLEGLSLEELIHRSSGDPELKGIFNNAAQVWNHSFYWHSMAPSGGGMPGGGLATLIKRDFGSFDAFLEEFKSKAASQFGSGWAWLVVDAGTLKIVTTSNADTPITQGVTPLLCVDVWEHAYYLDYQNGRADYLDVFFADLVDWSFAEKNLP